MRIDHNKHLHQACNRPPFTGLACARPAPASQFLHLAKRNTIRCIVLFICLLFVKNNSCAANVTYEYGILKLQNLTKSVSDQYEKGYISHSTTAVVTEKTNQIIVKPNLAFGVIIKTSKRVTIQASWLYPDSDEKTRKNYFYETRKIDDSIFYYFIFEKQDGENNTSNEGKYTLKVFIDETKESRSFDFYVTNQ